MNIKIPSTFVSKDGALPSKLDRLADDLGLKTSAARNFLEIALENAILMDKKQQDYGSRNISSFGTVGVIVRMNDKFERIKNLIKNRRKSAVNENVKDTFRDLSNYSIIALMLENKTWPDE